MGEQTNISWTHHTFNPWWGCWKIAPECASCYAEAFDHRLNGEHWGRTAPRKFFGDKHWNEPLKWDRAAEKASERRRVFAGSMCDWAERHPVAEINDQMRAARMRMWRLIRMTRNLNWLLLSKRPESFSTMLPWLGGDRLPEPLCRDCADFGPMCPTDGLPCEPRAPWPRVWLGVSCGSRESLDRVSILRRTPAAIRFISCEPLLEHITAGDWDVALGPTVGEPTPIHWLIVGDESGHGARPANPEWVRTARDAAARHGVAFHFKQWAGKDAPGIGGERVKGKRHLPLLDDVQHADFPEVNRVR